MRQWRKVWYRSSTVPGELAPAITLKGGAVQPKELPTYGPRDLALKVRAAVRLPAQARRHMVAVRSLSAARQSERPACAAQRVAVTERLNASSRRRSS